MGFCIGLVITKTVRKLLKRVDRRVTNKVFRKFQVLSGALMSFMHGAQDGQKFMGILLLGVFIYSGMPITSISNPPLWIILLCSLTMAFGVSIGGYKIIKTVGMKMVKMEPYEGTCADLSGIICLLFAILYGLPVSTTHTKTTAIMGVGASKRLSNVNWIVVKDMLLSWVLVFPGCGLLSYIFTKVLMLLFV